MREEALVQMNANETYMQAFGDATSHIKPSGHLTQGLRTRLLRLLQARLHLILLFGVGSMLLILSFLPMLV